MPIPERGTLAGRWLGWLLGGTVGEWTRSASLLLDLLEAARAPCWRLARPETHTSFITSL